MELETHLKTVKGKTVLVPSLADFRRHLPLQAGPVDGKALRKSLLAGTPAVLVCPVTVRRHLKTLGLTVRT